MPRVNIIEKSRKPVECGRCRTTIPAGGPYRYITPRYGSKQIRCMSNDCRFRPTDLSSAKTARIAEAIEDAQDQLCAAMSHDEIQSILSEVAQVAQEVADEYQEASDNWAGGSGHEEFQEKADTCSSFADELESWSYSGEENEDAIRAAAIEDEPRFEMTDDDYEEHCIAIAAEAWETELQSMRDEAADVLDGFDL